MYSLLFCRWISPSLRCLSLALHLHPTVMPLPLEHQEPLELLVPAPPAFAWSAKQHLLQTPLVRLSLLLT